MSDHQGSKQEVEGNRGHERQGLYNKTGNTQDVTQTNEARRLRQETQRRRQVQLPACRLFLRSQPLVIS